MKLKICITAVVVAILSVAVWMLGCSAGTSSGSMGTVTTSLTDPPTCSTGSGGPYAHVYVSISAV